MLPSACSITPYNASVVFDRKTLQAAAVLICHRWFAGLGNRFLAQQISSAVHSVLQAAGKNAGIETGEHHFDARAVGSYLTARYVIGGPLPADFFRLARQIEIGARASRHHQGCVPKRLPFFTLDQCRGKR